jgi:hypothetical protein
MFQTGVVLLVVVVEIHCEIELPNIIKKCGTTFQRQLTAQRTLHNSVPFFSRETIHVFVVLHLMFICFSSGVCPLLHRETRFFSTKESEDMRALLAKTC